MIPRCLPGLLLGIALCAQVSRAQEIMLQAPRVGTYHPLDTDIRPGNFFAGGQALLKVNTTLVEQKQEIDFEQRQVTFKHVDKLGIVLWQYRYGELADYLRSRHDFVLADLWYKNLSDHQRGGQEQKDKRFALEFQLPVQYPTWAQRILGKEPPKLSIHGYEEVTVKYTFHDRDEEGVDESQRTNGRGTPAFENQYSLNVEGSVGRLINVSMRTTSEEQFAMENPLKDIKIQYKGEGNELEDEIIQEVTAGYTHFQLPGATFAGYSESREGLFGISIKSKFGPLMLTTIASHEQGEATKQTFPLSSSSAEQAQIRNEKSFADHQVLYHYFFLDTLYRSAYNAKYNMANPQDVDVPRVSRTLQVWRLLDERKRQEIHSDPTGIYRVDSSRANSVFKKMLSGWEVDYTEGWIRFDDTVTVDASTIIGISMTTSDTTVVPTKGDTTIIDTSRELNRPRMRGLWILKPLESELDTSDEAFKLMWRNVFKIDPIQGEFNLTVKRINAAGGEGDSLKTKRNTDTLYSYLLGLTDFSGKPVGSDRIYNTEKGYLILPPYEDGFFGNEPFRNPALGKDNTCPEVYDNLHTSTEFKNIEQTKYLIEITGRHTSRRTTLQLGWGVIEGSEKLVTNGGTQLRRDQDYRIDYGTGEVQLTSIQATSATSIDAEYQRESIFVPEKKVFLGASAELKLPAISETSLLAGSILFQSTSSRDKVPRIGSEPFNKVLLDLNTKLDFEPEWMTDLVNTLPLISTDAKSSVRVDLEVAHSRMKPTSKGEAFVDDFESSKESYQLFANHANWYQASPPFTSPRWDTLLHRPPAWSFHWYSPVYNDTNWVNRYSIMRPQGTDTMYLSRSEKAADVLRLECKPAGPLVLDRYKNPWAGIMTSLYEGSTDRSKDKYFEFYVKAENKGSGSKGVLYIDMGQVSEDLCLQGKPPNGRLDDEDSAGLGRVQEFNRGLDKIGRDEDEWYFLPNEAHDGWDSLGYKNPWLARPEDPSHDNWKEYSTDREDLKNAPYANGTQGNGGYRGGRQLTSEDINGDGFSTTESFFRFRINLDSLASSSFNVPDANVRDSNGWYFVRIPLKDSTAAEWINKPSWQKIRYVRLWMSEFGDQQDLAGHRTVYLSEMEFVGNEWQEKATATQPETTFVFGRVFGTPDSIVGTPIVTDSAVKIDASVINTVSDANYLPPPGIVRETIPGSRGNTKKPEQSLRLRFQRLKSGDEALVRKRYPYQALDLSAYRTLSLYVHSDRDYQSDSLYFVFRFGTNDSSYYEFRTPVSSGWNRDWGEEVVVDLTTMAALKLQFLGDTSLKVIDTITQAPGSTRSYYRVRAQTNSPPNFSSIRMLMLGVVRGQSGTAEEIAGELWVDEMKVIGLQGFGGSAALAKLSTSWADLFTLNGSLDYRDGNFRTMTDSKITPGNSRVSGGVDGSLGLDKFLPKEWGVTVPVNASVNMSIDRPQLVPNSDIPLPNSKGEPDKLADFLWPEGSRSKHYEQVSYTQSIGTRYSKSANSDNPLANMTVDRLAVEDLSANATVTTRGRGQRPDSSGDYYETDTTRNYSTRITYDLSPRKPPAWTKWRPFASTKSTWVPPDFKQLEFNLLPKKLSFELAEMRYTTNSREDQKLTGTRHRSKTMILGHEFTLNYSPISPLLDFDYTVGMDRNLDKEVENRDGGWGNFFLNTVAAPDDKWGYYLFLKGESMRTQTAKATLDPRIFGWLTHSADYSVSFKGNPQRTNDTTNYLNLEVSSTFDFRTTFNFARFLGDLAAAADSIKGWGSTLESMKKGVETINFRDIRFTYSASMALRNRNMYNDSLRPYLGSVDRGDLLEYEFGLASRSPWDVLIGEMDDTDEFGMLYRRDNDHKEVYLREDSRDVKRTWKTETGFSFPQPIDLTISTLSLDYSKSYLITPDVTRRDTSTVFPSIGINASTGLLNKIPIIQNNFSSMTLSMGYNYKLNTLKKITEYDAVRSEDTTREISHNFTPLVSTSGTFKALPINFNYEHGFSVAETDNTTASFNTRKTEHTDNIDLSYTIERTSKRTEIKILWWTVPLKGNLETGATANHRAVLAKSTPRTGGPGDANTTEEWREFSAAPTLSYVFSEKVTGKASIKWSRRMQKEPSKRTDRDLDIALGVRITF